MEEFCFTIIIIPIIIGLILGVLALFLILEGINKYLMIFICVISIILGSVFLFNFLTFDINYTKNGPSSGMVRTEGIFSPGGYIEFNAYYGVTSLEGMYAGELFIEPKLTDSQIQKGINWKDSKYNIGYEWDEDINAGFSVDFEEIEITEIIINIPQNSLLTGENISIQYRAEFIYPVGPLPDPPFGFINKNGTIEEEIKIFISGEKPSDWYSNLRIQGSKLNNLEYIIGSIILLALILFVFFGFCFIGKFLWDKIKNRN